MSDINLIISRAAGGNTKSYLQLYKMFHREVYLNCLIMLDDKKQAQNILQQTFFTANIKLAKYDEKQSFSVWLNRIAAEKCCGKFLPEDRFDGEAVDYEYKGFALPKEYIKSEERRKALMEVITKKLSLYQRYALVMYHSAEMSIAEISEMLKCSEDTVNYYLVSTADTIREQLSLREYTAENDDINSFFKEFISAEAETVSIDNIDAEKEETNSSESVKTNPVSIKRIIFALTVLVMSIALCLCMIPHYNNSIDNSAYEYYELLNEEWERTKVYTENFNSVANKVGEYIFFTDITSMSSSYFRYNITTGKTDEIISDLRETTLEIDGQKTECTVMPQGYSSYHYNGYIYGIGYIQDLNSEKMNWAVFKYDEEGNIIDVFIMDDIEADYNREELYSQMTEALENPTNFQAIEMDNVTEVGIMGITNEGKIYIISVEYEMSSSPLMPEVKLSCVHRINADLTGYETNFIPTNIDNEYCCGLYPKDGKIYAEYCRKDAVMTEESYLVAYNEKTLEKLDDAETLKETDFLNQNKIKMHSTVGKYAFMDEYIYDIQAEKVFANVPTKIGSGFLQYEGGNAHLYFNGSEFMKVRLPDNIDYKNISDSEIQKYMVDKKISGLFAASFQRISEDELILFGTEDTYYCCFSTGEKKKIYFPWSAEESNSYFKYDDNSFIEHGVNQ